MHEKYYFEKVQLKIIKKFDFKCTAFSSILIFETNYFNENYSLFNFLQHDAIHTRFPNLIIKKKRKTPY